MVAPQVISLLWAASLAVAAPQLDFGDQRSAQAQNFIASRQVSSSGNLNQNEIVTDVVFALQPSIEEAVRNALRGLSSSSVSSSVSSSGSSFGSSSSSGAAGFNSATSAAAEANANAEYNFEYKVADEDKQTYITKQETRNGDALTGSYSYVDPTGALITVNYEAGPMGFSATTDKQDGFVSIRAQNSNRGSSSVSSSSSGSRGSSVTSVSSNSVNSINQDSIIAQVLAALQPSINSAVQTAISSSSSSGTARSFQERPRVSSNSVESQFGNGVSVNIDTPEYNIAY